MPQAQLKSPAPASHAESLLESVIDRSTSQPRSAEGIAVGRLERLAADGTACVSIAALGVAAVSARTLAPLDPSRVGEAVALGFEAGDPLRPIILGFMLQPTPPTEVVVDGGRLTLHAEREIELRCGDAALVLSADGRIQLRGTYITSHASATQRILGGSVNVN